MKEKNQKQSRHREDLDHTDHQGQFNLAGQDMNEKQAKKGHSAHLQDFVDDWESEDAHETVSKETAHAHRGRKSK